MHYSFPVTYNEILQRIDKIDPTAYATSRNYADGAVTLLSPYISRGVISTKTIFDHLLYRREIPLVSMKKLIQELAWREYWQSVWRYKGNEINEDLRQSQKDVKNFEMPLSIIKAQTGIHAVDQAIKDFYITGYLHNHMRMYIASISCNLAGSHWRTPARWMYYHLLDADWASNALNWQWIAGSNSHRKYFANQQNINRFFYSAQHDTYLDTSYEQLLNSPVPGVLLETMLPDLKVDLPPSQEITIDHSKPTYLYNFYNLDPEWGTQDDANRILILEPSHFKDYPVSSKTIQWVIELSRIIPEIQLFTKNFSSLGRKINPANTFFKQHPLNLHYQGKSEPREQIFHVEGYYRSFSAFWKQAEKQLP